MTCVDACTSEYSSGPDLFTGKERDVETGFANGNDYFDARYYASSLGRFLSPDWAAKIEPVPYATMTDPQSLNLYAYVRNNPVSRADADGHCDLQCAINIAIGVGAGVARDGGVGAYARNVGIGALKGAGQAAYDTYSLVASGGNPGALAGSMINQPAALAPSNQTQAQAAIVTSTVITVAATLPAAPEVESAEVATEIPQEAISTENLIPTSIPAGPSPRPTAAQQDMINAMGDAHGCSTCGATSPGTKSGNWVGDHQPPTALNASGGPQTYRPQCLQCSRQQGGQVAAAVRAARRENTPQQ